MFKTTDSVLGSQPTLLDIPATERLKRCRRCARELPLAAFKPDPNRVCGRLAVCSECIKKGKAASYAKLHAPQSFSKGAIIRRRWEATERGKSIVRSHRKARTERRWVDAKLAEKSLFYGAKTRARRAGIPFSIRVEDVSIPERCPILDVPLIVSRGKAAYNSPSLDRTNSDLGYVPGNVAVISFKANTIKSNATAAELQRVLDYVRRISDQ